MKEKKVTQAKLKKTIGKLNVLIVFLVLVFCVVLSFSRYRRFEQVVVYTKPPKAAEQKKIEETPEPEKEAVTADSGQKKANPEEEKQYDESFTLYLVGDEFVAQAGNGEVTIDVRNKSDSTHDIVMSWKISKEEMKKHGISTAGMTEDEWTILETGLFEPGYSLDTGQLLPLPDGSYLPAGKYDLTLIELYYHHETGALSSYQSRIPITLEVES